MLETVSDEKILQTNDFVKHQNMKKIFEYALNECHSQKDFLKMDRILKISKKFSHKNLSIVEFLSETVLKDPIFHSDHYWFGLAQ